MTRRITPLVAAATAVVLLTCGCSDDLVCPEPAGTLPYISALVVERPDGGDESTHAEVVCTADPLPSQLITFINGRMLPTVVLPHGIGLLASLDDDTVLWQPGTLCSLEVTTDYGYATATVVMPDAAAVTAPGEISLGDELRLFWESVTDADYYEVSAVLVTDEGAPMRGAPDSRDTLVLSATTRETFAVFLPGSLSSTGVVSGFVETVAGPFPESGAAGNISGDGWGFFTLRYRDSG
ncbi:MAG: hypothetical protein KAW67_02420, partial [Candidatus Eisenbacteria sp.]|nr:hypothetical protein [Candidatus Eisenbacteria bacterium]